MGEGKDKWFFCSTPMTSQRSWIKEKWLGLDRHPNPTVDEIAKQQKKDLDDWRKGAFGETQTEHDLASLVLTPLDEKFLRSLRIVVP